MANLLKPGHTEQANRINTLVGGWWDMFVRKNATYGDGEVDLGIRGYFPDLWRKAVQIRRAIWDGKDTSAWSEQPREILLDMIGHCFLLIDAIDREADMARGEERILLCGSPPSQEDAIRDMAQGCPYCGSIAARTSTGHCPDCGRMW